MDDILAANVSLVAIGTGDLDYARDFIEQQHIAFPVLVDDRSVSYRAVGTKKGSVLQLANPRLLVSGAKTMAAGRRQARSGPKPLVFGAAHVIRPDGSVPYAWINDDFDDNAPISDVLASLRR